MQRPLKLEKKVNWVDTILILHINVSVSKDNTKEVPILNYGFRLVCVSRSLQKAENFN